MRYALIENNIVKDIFIEPEGVSIEECFTSEITSLYIQCSDNITQDDFYNPETQEFIENPNKKFPNYLIWFEALRNKQEELSKYSYELNPVINNLSMNIQKIQEYKNLLQFVLTGVDDMVEIDGMQFTGDDFKLMIHALKQFESDKSIIQQTHLINFSSFNHSSNIEEYDFTTDFPETIISI